MWLAFISYNRLLFPALLGELLFERLSGLRDYDVLFPDSLGRLREREPAVSLPVEFDFLAALRLLRPYAASGVCFGGWGYFRRPTVCAD